MWLTGKRGTLILLMLINVSHLENLSHDIFVGEIIWCPEFYAQSYIPSVPEVFFF
jgi:hypothetical protein